MANVISYILKVQDEITPVLNKVSKNLFGMNIERKYDILKGAISEASQFEKQMVEVTKVLDEGFVSNIQNVQWLKEELRGVGRVVPKNIDEIMLIAAEGSKMGVAAEKIPEFTKGVAEVSRAFEISSEEAANKFVKVLYSFGKDVSYESINYLGGEMNEISNNMKAKGGELLYALNLSTAALSNAGLNEKQIIALNAAGLQVGLPSGVTGNALIKYATVMNKIQETRKGRWALHDLGFSEEKWNVMRKNPELRNEEVLKRLSDLRAKGNLGDIEAQTKYQGVLDTMFGFYRGKDIDRIIAQLPEYYKALELVSNEEKIRQSLEVELSQVTDTFNDKILLLKNSFREFIGEIGELFIPALKKLTDYATTFLQYATDGIRSFKKRDLIEDSINIIDMAKAGIVTAGTYAAMGVGIGALAISSPIVAPVLAAGAIAGAAGAGVLSYGYFRKQHEERESPDLDEHLKKIPSVNQSNFDLNKYTKQTSLNNPDQSFDLNESTGQISSINQNNSPILLKIEGGLKVPKGYGIENLNFTPVVSQNRNFSIITE